MLEAIPVDVRNDSKEIKPERVRQLLSEWFAARHAAAVVFNEKMAPENNSLDDYVIAYEAVFEPRALDQARVEIWATSDGHVAIGFEKQERIANRLGVKKFADRFVAGYEPRCMNEAELLTTLDVIADGEVATVPTVIPLLGLVSTKAVATHATIQRLVSVGRDSTNWLSSIRRSKLYNSQKVLRYRRWE